MLHFFISFPSFLRASLSRGLQLFKWVIIMEMLMMVICLMSVFYNEPEISVVETLTQVVEEVPEVAQSVDSIKFFAEDNIHVGYSLRNNITIFGLSQYSEFQQKYVILHEMAYCWAFDILNDNYEEYEIYIKKDNSVISSYSTTSIAEDFADAVAYYFLADGFKECFPNRTEFIERCLNGITICD